MTERRLVLLLIRYLPVSVEYDIVRGMLLTIATGKMSDKLICARVCSNEFLGQKVRIQIEHLQQHIV